MNVGISLPVIRPDDLRAAGDTGTLEADLSKVVRGQAASACMIGCSIPPMRRRTRLNRWASLYPLMLMISPPSWHCRAATRSVLPRGGGTSWPGNAQIGRL